MLVFLPPLNKYFNEHDQSKIVHAIELFQTKDYSNAIKEFNLIAVSKGSSEQELKAAFTHRTLAYNKT